MSTGGKLPGIATFSRPMTVTHERYTQKVQRLGTITGPQFPSPDPSSNVVSGSPSNCMQFTTTLFITEQRMKAQSENFSNEKAYENQLMMNYLQRDYEPKSIKEIVQRMNYIVHETLTKHVLTGQLQCQFPLSMIVGVAGGGAEWIEFLNVKQRLNIKLHGEIQQGILRLDINNDHTVKIINIPEHKMDLVGLRVLYDYCS